MDITDKTDKQHINNKRDKTNWAERNNDYADVFS